MTKLESSKLLITRRSFVVWMSAVAGARFSAFAEESAGIPSQPYFAEVNRALERLAKLGAPVAIEDAQQIATLARQNDNEAVGAAENILARYTLAKFAIGSDGSVHVSVGAAPRTLMEQGWRMFLIRVANAPGRTDNIALFSGLGSSGAFGTPGQMMNASRFPFSSAC